jgi:hypothetical protein
MMAVAAASGIVLGVLVHGGASADVAASAGTELAPLDHRIVFRAAPASWTPGANLFICEGHGFVVNHCRLVSAKLADPIADADGVVAETEFAVQYDFMCAGNLVHVGVQTGTSYQEFRLGAADDAITGIVSAGPLVTYDPDPAATGQRSFRPGCRLAVTKVTALPSAGTIRLWGVQAADEARVLSSSLALYELGKDYAALASWSTSKLKLLHDRLEVLVSGDPENLSLKMMLESVDAAMRRAPSPVTAEEFRAAGEALVQALRASLDAEVAKGAKMLAQFDKWHLAVEQTLKDALQSIPAS